MPFGGYVMAVDPFDTSKKERKIPYASLVKPTDLKKACYIDGPACVYQFQATPSPGYGEIRIDRFYAKIQHAESGKLLPEVFLASDEIPVVLLEPDSYNKTHSNLCFAEKMIVPNKGIVKPMKPPYLQPHQVETFQIRVNPKSPGFYRITLFLRVHTGNEKPKEIQLTQPNTWAFG